MTARPASTGNAATGVQPVAEARGVHKRFGATVALRDAHLTVRAGEIHALVGRNGAGKSTLVSILTGLQAPDRGEVLFDGRPAPGRSDREAWRATVACVYQKTTIAPDLSVAENLFLNRQSDGGPIRWRALRQRAGDVLARWGIDVDPAGRAGDLSVEYRQMVEIARALETGSRFIVLDEPTAQLDGPAIARLFDRIRALRDRGVTFLFISHHLDEIFELCDTATVFRDAAHVMTEPVAAIDRARLVRAMAGDAGAIPDAGSRPGPSPAAPAVLEVEGLVVAGECHGVDVTVGAGEVVGVTGIGGSGKGALAEAVAGLRRPAGGRILVGGRALRLGSPASAVAAGIGFVPPDRHRQGLVPLLSVAENATMTITDRLGRFGWISSRRRRRLAQDAIAALDIKTDGPEQPVSGLSGGNAQKVVMARALASDPDVLVLVNPTAGVDVRSKTSLLASVDAAARAGTGVLLVSDELEDLRLCDRVLVMFRGRVRSELARGWNDHAMVAATEGMDA